MLIGLKLLKINFIKVVALLAELVMFEESWHNPQVEEPAKLFALIKKFLRK